MFSISINVTLIPTTVYLLIIANPNKICSIVKLRLGLIEEFEKNGKWPKLTVPIIKTVIAVCFRE